MAIYPSSFDLKTVVIPQQRLHSYGHHFLEASADCLISFAGNFSSVSIT